MLTLPPALPASLGLRLGRLTTLDENGQIGGIYDILVRIVGADQIDAVMDKMDERGGTLPEAFRGLMTCVNGAYGAASGESKASASS